MYRLDILTIRGKLLESHRNSLPLVVDWAALKLPGFDKYHAVYRTIKSTGAYAKAFKNSVGGHSVVVVVPDDLSYLD
jgi:hypothetical protein